MTACTGLPRYDAGLDGKEVNRVRLVLGRELINRQSCFYSKSESR